MNSYTNLPTIKIDLGDKRLSKRFKILLNQITEKPNSSIPEACGNFSASKAAYRFFDNEQVDVNDIQESNFLLTKEKITTYDFVIVAQDTTDLNFTTHKNTKGIGYLDNEYCQGIKMHSSLAISPDGVPIGILDQQFIIRENKEYGKKEQRGNKPIEEKESYRWLKGAKSIQEKIDLSTKRVLMVADREADIYDLFAQKRSEGFDLLIRAYHNRKIEGEKDLLNNKILNDTNSQVREITVRNSQSHKTRKALVEVRFTEIEIKPPKNRKDEKLKSIKLNTISVKEIQSKEVSNSINWLLLTTLSIKNIEEALQCVKWYTMRWLIERYHYTLKSGCQVEKLQLETAERIKRAVATYSIVAWRILYITYLGRKEPEESSSLELKEHEWKSLYCFINKTNQSPTKPPTIKEAIFMLGKLGGFLSRKGDGYPGVKVIWRGLQHLNYISQTYLIFNKDVGND